MVKLTVLYKKPSDVEAFEKHYQDTHLPLAKKMPGLRRTEITHFFGSPGGEAKYYMMAELFFENKDALFAGLGSEEGKAAAKDVMSFAGDLITMMFGHVDA